MRQTVLLAVLLLAACGSQPDAPRTEPAKGPEAKPAAVAPAAPSPVAPAKPAAVAPAAPSPAAPVAPAKPAASIPAPPAPAVQAAQPFPHQESKLAADPAVRWGSLPNGARYALMSSKQPPGRLSLRLRMASGSLLEDDDQQGLAHMLEHMAFNGMKSFPSGTLVPRLQALGIGFGNDLNAHTSFDETVYKIDLPDTKPETVNLGLSLFADQAGGLLLTPEDIDKEKGIVLAELRDRDGPDTRLSRFELAQSYPGTRAPVRLPIGLAPIISAADHERLSRYYSRWYRPERMVLTAVGDIDLDILEIQVRSVLGAATVSAPAGKDPGLGKLETGESFSFLLEKEAEGTSVRIGRIHEHILPVDSVAVRREQFLRDLGEAVLNRRLRRITETDPACPIIGGGGYSYHWIGWYQAGVGAQAKPGRALDALGLITTEYRRMAEHGPTAAELAIEAASIRSGLDQAVAQAAARPNARLAEAILRSTVAREVFMSPTQERDLELALLAAATPAGVRDAFRAGWSDAPGRTVATISGVEDLGSDGDAKVAAAFRAAWTAPVAAVAERKAASWAYAVEAQPFTGTWSDGEWSTGSANGISYAVRRTDFQPGQVLVRVRLQARTGPHAPAIAELASRMFAAGGLGKHAASELEEVLSGTSVRFGGLGVEDGAVSLGVICQEKDLKESCELLRAWLTDAAWRDDAEKRAKTSWLQQLDAEATDLDATCMRQWATLVHAADAWRRPATKEEAAASTSADARAWLTPLLTNSPMTVAIVGDCDPKAAAALATGILGGNRPPVVVTATPEAARAALPEETPYPAGEHRYEVAGDVAKGGVLVSWPSDDIYDIHRTRRLSLLAGCVQERLREVLRERFHDSYSPSAWSGVGEEWRGQGSLNVVVTVAPERVEAARDAVLAIAAELSTEVPAALLEQVRNPALTGIAQTRRQNRWWLGLMSKAIEQPFRLEWQAGMEDDIKAATTAEMVALAKTYLVPEKALILLGTCKGQEAAPK